MHKPLAGPAQGLRSTLATSRLSAENANLPPTKFPLSKSLRSPPLFMSCQMLADISMKHRPSGVNPAPPRGSTLSDLSTTCLPVATSHLRNGCGRKICNSLAVSDRSTLPRTCNVRPSCVKHDAPKARLFFPGSALLKRLVSFPVAISVRTRVRPSARVVNNCRPSGVNCNGKPALGMVEPLLTKYRERPAAESLRNTRFVPSATVQMRTVESFPQLASDFPSGAKVTASTGPAWPSPLLSM